MSRHNNYGYESDYDEIYNKGNKKKVKDWKNRRHQENRQRSKQDNDYEKERYQDDGDDY